VHSERAGNATAAGAHLKTHLLAECGAGEQGATGQCRAQVGRLEVAKDPFARSQLHGRDRLAKDRPPAALKGEHFGQFRHAVMKVETNGRCGTGRSSFSFPHRFCGLSNLFSR
jgi:hypothetical protein